jgi:hypothetical protein
VVVQKVVFSLIQMVVLMKDQEELSLIKRVMTLILQMALPFLIQMSVPAAMYSKLLGKSLIVNKVLHSLIHLVLILIMGQR